MRAKTDPSGAHSIPATVRVVTHGIRKWTHSRRLDRGRDHRDGARYRPRGAHADVPGRSQRLRQRILGSDRADPRDDRSDPSERRSAPPLRVRVLAQARGVNAYRRRNLPSIRPPTPSPGLGIALSTAVGWFPIWIVIFAAIILVGTPPTMLRMASTPGGTKHRAWQR